MGKNHCGKCGAKVPNDKALCTACQNDADNDKSQAARKKNAKDMKVKKK